MLNYELVKQLKEVHFGSQLELYMSKKISFKNYDIYLGDLIDDTYWNLATNIKSKSKEEFLNDWEDIKNNFREYKRQPVVYLTPDAIIYSQKDELGLDVLYTDSWLILDNLDNNEYTKSQLDINIEEVNSKNLEEFIQGVSDGFSSDDPNEPYMGLPDKYREALREGFKKENIKYNIKHYLAKYNNVVVGTATVNFDDKIACVYNVTTNNEYKHSGICKEMMSYLIRDMRDKSIKIICLQTEQGFYTEEVYLKLGFRKLFNGVALGLLGR